MADEFCFSLLHTTTLQILQAAGFESGHVNATHVLTNVFEQYLKLLSTTVSAYSQLSGRTTGNIYDVMDAFTELAIDLPNLKSWLTEEAKSLSPSWTEQGDPSRILEGIVNKGLNRQEDVIMYEFGDYASNEEDSQPSEEEDEVKEQEDKENNLPDYVPPYFPAFPVIVLADDIEEPVIIEPKVALPSVTSSIDALPLPNIVKKKTKPIDNPFTHLKPFDESMLATADKDQPEALSLSVTVKDNNNKPVPLATIANTNDNNSSNIPKRRRRSEALSQLISEIHYHQNDEPNKRNMVQDIRLFNETTRDGAAPGNTMFSQEPGLLDKLMVDLAPPIAISKLTTPNLLMDIVVPPGFATPSSTIRLNMTPTSSRKPSLGGITIEESPSQKPPISAITKPATAEDKLLKADTTPTTIKIAPISLASLSSPIEEKAPKEKKPKEKKEKATKTKKKLTISLRKSKLDLKLTIPTTTTTTTNTNTTINHDEINSAPSSITTTTSTTTSTTTNDNSTTQSQLLSSATTATTAGTLNSAISESLSAPKIRFKIKLPSEQPLQKPEESTPPVSPKPAVVATDVINCICDNPLVDYGTFMIACDTCGVWYHGLCVGIAESDQVEEWLCKRCTIY